MSAREVDGRLIAAAIVVVFFVALISIRVATGSTPWQKVGVGLVSVSFADMRSVTSSWDCERRGIDVFPDNPCDPFGRPANYPQLWTKVGVFGLGESATVPLAITTAILFFVAALAAVGRLEWWEGLVYALALLAPATLLGVERGNVDLLMFALVVLGVVLLKRSPYAGAAPILFAAVLKLFPTFALVVLFRTRDRLRAGVLACALFGIYVIATLDDIRILREAIPRVVGDSYGAGVVIDALHSQVKVSWAQSATEVRYLRLGLIALGLLLAGVLLLVRRASTGSVDERRLDLFWAGGAIYAGTYVFGSNFDYRLAFLVLCVPQLCAWSSRGGAPVRWPTAALVTLLACLWLGSMKPPLPFGLQTWYIGLSFPPEEVLNWLLFAWLAAALAGSTRFPWPHLRR